MSKYHEAQSGERVGQMVPCHARKNPCRFGEERHEYFETPKEAARFNELLLEQNFGLWSYEKEDELRELKEKSFRIKESLPVAVFNDKAVDEVGNQWSAKLYGDGSEAFWSVEAVDAGGVHLAQGSVPASTAEEAINDMVASQRYKRRLEQERVLDDLRRKLSGE